MNSLFDFFLSNMERDGLEDGEQLQGEGILPQLLQVESGMQHPDDGIMARQDGC